MRYSGYSGRFKNGGGIPVEKKFLDTSLATTTVASTGTSMEGAVALIEIVRGTGENERNGSRVRIKSVHAKITLTMSSATSATTTSDIVRIMIGIDKQANAAVCTVGDLLESTAIDSFRNIENLHRFVWMYDKYHKLNVHGLGSNGTTHITGRNFKSVRINLKCNVPIYYDGGTGAVGEIRSHNLWAFAISEAGTIKMDNKWRIRYYG